MLPVPTRDFDSTVAFIPIRHPGSMWQPRTMAKAMQVCRLVQAGGASSSVMLTRPCSINARRTAGSNASGRPRLRASMLPLPAATTAIGTRPGHRERHHAHRAVATSYDDQIGAFFQRARGLRATGVLCRGRRPGDFRAGPDAALHGTAQAAEVDLYRVVHHRDPLGTGDPHQLMVTAGKAGATRSPRRRSLTAFGWQTRQRRALTYRRCLRARRAGRRRCGSAPVLRRSRPTSLRRPSPRA